MNISPADLFALLSHETRLRSMLLLKVFDELCVCELTRVLRAPQPHVSRHLGQLRAAGLVADRRQGQWIYYRLNHELPAWVSRVLDAAERGTAGLSPYVEDREHMAAAAGAVDCAR
ncbi:MAG: metalloregulator ArsR/SmtB family transcription factor [Gammaproteobacteria bacterium]|nr:metalloregulator ArsR/SmtB family transcription factor [Gammaproteobacteria bacterium]